MSDPGRELRLENLPGPPLFELVDAGERVFEVKEVGGETATVGLLLSSRELAEEFAAEADDLGMPAFSGLEPERLEDWAAVEGYALSGADYVLAVTGAGTGLFHAGDVAALAAERAPGEIPLPLYVLADERGEAPLISVETEGGEVSVISLFTSPEKARAFRERAAYLDLPDSLGRIDGRDGLRRHALVAREAGADYAVVDPEAGTTEAVPIEDLIS
ncbi:MAG: hypothetical protein AB1425_12865 [Actinomycetota bacterium]